jgi:hypothetical protein
MGDNIRYGYTTEELYDNYTFKLIKRALMREFPYIKNVFVNPFDLGKYNTIFLNFEFDPAIWEETYKDKFQGWLKKEMDKGKYVDLSYPITASNNITYEEYQPIRKSIEKVMSEVIQSEAVPQELKIQGHRPVAIGTWHINRRSGTPDFMF